MDGVARMFRIGEAVIGVYLLPTIDNPSVGN
jgi:hypothetical protein